MARPEAQNAASTSETHPVPESATIGVAAAKRRGRGTGCNSRGIQLAPSVKVLTVVQILGLWHNDGVTTADRESPPHRIAELHADLECQRS